MRTSLLGSLDPRTRQEEEPTARYSPMVGDTAREQAICQALKAAGDVAAALQARLIEEHNADPESAAAQSTFANSLKLLRQARERLGQGRRAAGAGSIAESDEIWVRNR